MAAAGLTLAAVGLVVGLITLIIAIVQDRSDPAELRQLRDFLAPIGGGTTVIVVLVACVVVGLGLVALAPVVSHRILRRHDVHRPWTVTLAGTGVGLVAAFTVSQAIGLILGFLDAVGDVAWASGSGSTALSAAEFLRTGMELILVTAGTAAVGSLSWWWMAHLLRRD